MVDIPKQEQLLQMINGYMISQALRSVAELEIADKLASGPKTAEQLAGASIRPSSLYRVMRALCSVGVFVENDGVFELNELGALLRRDSAESLWSAAVMMPNEFGKSFDFLGDAIRTGENTFKTANGALGWDYMVANPERGSIFDNLMEALHGQETKAIIDAYEFTAADLVIDVGGGNGDVLSTILTTHQRLKGVLFDRPDVVTRTADSFKQRGLIDRCVFEGGDFFERVPSGGGLYILRHILHDWGDSDAAAILESCRKAMDATGKVLIIEGIIEPGNAPSSYKWLDLVMMLCWGGMERTEAQFQSVVERAGLEIERIIPTTTEVSLIECRLRDPV